MKSMLARAAELFIWLRLRVEIALVRASGRFDETYYLATYPDVATAGNNPIRHFCERGWREKRDPGPWFDTSFQTKAARPPGINPLVQWQVWGRWLGRPATYAQVERLRCHPPQVDFGKPDVVMVMHECTRTGAPIFLRSLARQWRDRHGLQIHFLVLAYGSLLDELCDEFACTLVPTLPVGRRALLLEAGLMSSRSVFYFNSAASLKAVGWLAWHKGPKIVHLHEIGETLDMYRQDLVEVLRSAPTVVTVNAKARSQVEAMTDVVSDRIFIIPPAVELREPCLTAAVDGPRLIVGCGTASLRKGADLFCEVAARLRGSPLSDVRFVWVGREGDAGMSELIERLGLHDIVSLVGEVDDPRLWFERAALLLLPSREDPYPLVCLEAAECGLPTVCFDERAGGIGAFVGGDAGVVVPSFDVDAMADAVARLLEDPTLLPKLGAAARSKVEQMHAIPVTAQPIFNLVDWTARDTSGR